MKSSKSGSFLRGAALTAVALNLGACGEVPDYKIVALHIPTGVSALLAGYKSDADKVPTSSIAVPVYALSGSARDRYSIGLGLGDLLDTSGVVSLATVDVEGCITSVVSSSSQPRSGTGVTQVELELDPTQNPNVIPISPYYSTPAKCSKFPGYTGSIPSMITPIPTRPVIINAIRDLHGPAGLYEGAIHLYGWGLDKGSVTMTITQDPSLCFPKLLAEYSQYTAQFQTLLKISYPTLTLGSYGAIDLKLSSLQGMARSLSLPSQAVVALITCIAVSSLSFDYASPEFGMAHFGEMLPPK